MNATKLVQEIKDANVLATQSFFTIEHIDHDINIWFSQRRKKWILEIDGAVIKDSARLETTVNRLIDFLN